MKITLAVCLFLSTASLLHAQGNVTDTIQTKKQEENSAIFLNAASDGKPREISLGLPTNASNAVQIFEDGMPVSYYLYQMYPYKSWHGGVSADKTGTMNPMESAMRYGEINYFVDSYNITGSDKLKGGLSYSLSQYGQNKIDVNLSGNLGKEWGYSLSTFQNLDRGSNHLTVNHFMDRHQFYKGVLSKTFSQQRGKFSLVYQFVDYMSIKENFGPFIFVGDGSVKPLDGFQLGHDNYYPKDRDYTYMDFMTGKIKTEDYVAGSTDRSHHVTMNLNYKFQNGLELIAHSRLKTGNSYRTSMNISGTEDVEEGSPYTYENGAPFTGLLQRRNMLHFDAFETTWFNTAYLKGAKTGWEWITGFDYWLNHGGTTTSTASTAHEVKKNPKRIYRNGEAFYNFNTAAEYYSGYENRLAIFASNRFRAWDRMELQAFLRLEYLNLDGNAANNIGEDNSNSRYSGFNLTQGKITSFYKNYLNGALGFSMTQNLRKGLDLQAEYTWTRKHNTLFNYGGYTYPSDEASDTGLLRAGLSYRNSWLNVVSQILYIYQNHINTRAIFQHRLEKNVGEFPIGYTESLNLPVSYGITSLGWTTDALITPAKDLTLNIAFTIRNPQYRDFIFNPIFSDGISLHYDFSGKNVTNLHKTELTVSPSYSPGKWRYWFTARYISKQYINKTNSLFFKGRVETFGGIDYNLSPKVKMSLNVINLLNQKGASGVISSADLIEDASNYSDYIMAGTFIRPFTIEFGTTIKF